jgi:hypothetical protein
LLLENSTLLAFSPLESYKLQYFSFTEHKDLINPVIDIFEGYLLVSASLVIVTVYGSSSPFSAVTFII